jgi:hypothetical protein
MTDNTNTPNHASVPPGNLPEDSNTVGNAGNAAPPNDGLNERIDRLAGERAPDITPEEFSRLQKLGSLNLDAKGRIMLHREDGSDPGVSVRKRRAWY